MRKQNGDGKANVTTPNGNRRNKKKIGWRRDNYKTKNNCINQRNGSIPLSSTSTNCGSL